MGVSPAAGSRLEVTPEQLHAAAGTLRSVSIDLAQDGDLGLGSDALGSQALAIALADFCQQADALNTAFADVIHRTGTHVDIAGSSYDATDAAAASSYAGPH
jgi:hypothetical protein